MSVLSVFLLFRLTDARGAEHGEDLAAGLGFEQIAHCHVGPNQGHVNPKIRVGCLFDAVLGGGVEAETGEHEFAVPRRSGCADGLLHLVGGDVADFRPYGHGDSALFLVAVGPLAFRVDEVPRRLLAPGG